MLRIVDLGPIPETVAILVCAFGLFVIERDGMNAKLMKLVQLARLGYTVMIHILPQSQ